MSGRNFTPIVEFSGVGSKPVAACRLCLAVAPHASEAGRWSSFSELSS
jgi:hypothetical protein